MTDTNERNRFDDLELQTLDLIGDVGADAQIKNFPFLKFKDLVTKENGKDIHHGIWKTNTTDLTGFVLIGLTDEAAMGWARFKDDRLLEQQMVPVLGHRRPLRPNSLTDKNLWEKWGNDPDRRKDPWSPQSAIAFKDPETMKKVYVFNATSAAARFWVGALFIDFKHKRRRPLVKLSFEKRDGEEQLDPVLEIVGHTEDCEPTIGLNLARNKEAEDLIEAPLSSSLQNGSGGNGSIKHDMDDDIPF